MDKRPYEERAAKEREEVAAQVEAYRKALEDAGIRLDEIMADENGSTIGPKDPLDLVLPVGRIRKIVKLDPEVKNMSKEALHLVVKCTELFTAKLGQETTGVARMQNRRTLLPQDVAHVCRHRDPFLFLKDDIRDLLVAQQESKEQQKQQQEEKEHNELKQLSKQEAAKESAAAGSKPLTAYFGASLKP